MKAKKDITIRDAIRLILGEESANGIFKDCGDEWAIFAAISMIESKGGPKTDIEKRFTAWWDKQKAQPRLSS